MHGTYARELQQRTSLGTPIPAAKRAVAAAVVAAATAQRPVVQQQPMAAMAAQSERPVRVGMGSGFSA